MSARVVLALEELPINRLRCRIEPEKDAHLFIAQLASRLL